MPAAEQIRFFMVLINLDAHASLDVAENEMKERRPFVHFCAISRTASLLVRNDSGHDDSAPKFIDLSASEQERSYSVNVT